MHHGYQINQLLLHHKLYNLNNKVLIFFNKILYNNFNIHNKKMFYFHFNNKIHLIHRLILILNRIYLIIQLIYFLNNNNNKIYLVLKDNNSKIYFKYHKIMQINKHKIMQINNL